MPLPDGGGVWPPPAQTPILDKIAEWSAWYSGDPEQLSVFYGGETAGAYDEVSRARIINRPSQYKGGVVGRLARWWWGEPIPHGDRRAKLHLPIAGDIAATSADLLFSEPPTLTVEDAATQDRLDALADLGLRAELLEAAEVCAALGGVYLRTCWDREVRPEGPWLSPVHPDAAVPEWRWGVLRAVTFWRVVAQDGKTVVRHLERHEPGAIFHALYEGTHEDLGRRIPLGEFPDTAGLVEALTDGDMIETNVPTLTAGYVPNIRPNRIWRAIPQAAPLGRSDFAGAEPFMDALDEVYSSLMRDVRIGKGRLVVPSTYLENRGPGQGAAWLDREAYEAVDMLGGGDRLELAAHQFAIRVNEHLTAAEHLVAQIIRTAGYSAQSFGMQGDVAVTATEVRARERRSMITRGKKVVYWSPFVAARVENLLQIDREMFGMRVEAERPRIQFGDSVSEDLLSLANTAAALRQAEAASTEVIVALVHPDWDETKIAEEVERIRREQGSPVDDPLAIRPVADRLGELLNGDGQDDEAADELEETSAA